eukprot:g48449.t1
MTTKPVQFLHLGTQFFLSGQMLVLLLLATLTLALEEEERLSTRARQGSGHLVALESGWDRTGWELFQNASEFYSRRIYGDGKVGVQTLTYKGTSSAIHVLQAVDVHTWSIPMLEWNTVTELSFETFTYQVIAHYVTKHTVVLDFGAHIGQTVLFSAQLAKQTIAIEGDPAAYAQLFYNVQLNADHPWARTILLQPGLVTANHTIISMKSFNPGNSCSRAKGEADAGCAPGWYHTLSEQQKLKHKPFEWKVRGYPMQHLLQVWGIRPSKHLFMKIDIESYEYELLPSWTDWLSDVKTKPTIWLTCHTGTKQRVQNDPPAQERMNRLRPLVLLYKWAYCYQDIKGNSGSGGYNIKDSPEGTMVNLGCGTMVLSDVAPPPFHYHEDVLKSRRDILST